MKNSINIYLQSVWLAFLGWKKTRMLNMKYYMWYLFLAEDPCSLCSEDAHCHDGECKCKEGFTGDGRTCENEKKGLYIGRPYLSSLRTCHKRECC